MQRKNPERLTGGRDFPKKFFAFLFSTLPPQAWGLGWILEARRPGLTALFLSGALWESLVPPPPPCPEDKPLTQRSQAPYPVGGRGQHSVDQPISAPEPHPPPHPQPPARAWWCEWQREGPVLPPGDCSEGVSKFYFSCPINTLLNTNFIK